MMGYPRDGARLTKVNGISIFVHETGGTAVAGYDLLFGARRWLVTMHGAGRLASPTELGSLANALIPGVPLQWALAASFGGHPHTLCAVESDGNPLPDIFTFMPRDE